MLKLSSATRLYTDVEILKRFAKFIYANNIQGERFDELLLMMSIILRHSGDDIKVFVANVIKKLEK